MQEQFPHTPPEELLEEPLASLPAEDSEADPLAEEDPEADDEELDELLLDSDDTPPEDPPPPPDEPPPPPELPPPDEAPLDVALPPLEPLAVDDPAALDEISLEVPLVLGWLLDALLGNPLLLDSDSLEAVLLGAELLPEIWLSLGPALLLASLSEACDALLGKPLLLGCDSLGPLDGELLSDSDILWLAELDAMLSLTDDQDFAEPMLIAYPASGAALIMQLPLNNTVSTV